MRRFLHGPAGQGKAFCDAKQLLVAIAAIDFAFLKQNQCCFELQM